MYSYSDSSEESRFASGVRAQGLARAKQCTCEDVASAADRGRSCRAGTFDPGASKVDPVCLMCLSRRKDEPCVVRTRDGRRTIDVPPLDEREPRDAWFLFRRRVPHDRRETHAARTCFVPRCVRRSNTSFRHVRVVAAVSPTSSPSNLAIAFPPNFGPIREARGFSDLTKRRTTALEALGERRPTDPSEKRARVVRFDATIIEVSRNVRRGGDGGEPLPGRGFLGRSEKSCGRTPLNRHTEGKGWGEGPSGNRTGNCQGGNVLHGDWSNRRRASPKRIAIGPSIHPHPSLRFSSLPRNPPSLSRCHPLRLLLSIRARFGPIDRAFLPSQRALQRKALPGPSHVDVLVHRHNTRQATRRRGARAALRHLRFPTCSERRKGRKDARKGERDACRSGRPCVRERDANGRRSEGGSGWSFRRPENARGRLLCSMV